jgi:hypothetical protein
VLSEDACRALSLKSEGDKQEGNDRLGGSATANEQVRMVCRRLVELVDNKPRTTCRTLPKALVPVDRFHPCCQSLRRLTANLNWSAAGRPYTCSRCLEHLLFSSQVNAQTMLGLVGSSLQTLRRC